MADNDFIVTRIPLRISFFGGGTDLPEYSQKYGGLVVSTTINRFVYVAVKRRDDGRLALNSLHGMEIWNSGDCSYGGWEDNLENPLVRAVLKETGVFEGGLSIWIDSDAPATGCGLGTSSALIVGLLQALHPESDRREIAEQAVGIEVELMGGGVQDCWACAFGGVNQIHFNQNGTTTIHAMEEFVDAENLMLFNTRIARDSAQVQSRPKSNAHLHAIKSLAEEFLLIRDKDKRIRFPSFLQDTWQLKRKVSTVVTDSLIDKFYYMALAAGAESGKILGAGGGGHFVFYVCQAYQEQVKKELTSIGLEYVPFAFDFSGVQVCNPSTVWSTPRTSS